MFMVSAASKSEREENSTQICANDKETWGASYFWLMAFGPLLLIVFGTFGNTITYFVLRRKAYKKNVVACALRYLAVLDNIILWTFLLKQFLVEMEFIEYDVTQKSHAACAIWSFYLRTIASIDSWLLVIITASRLIHISCPFKVHSVCSKFNYAVAFVMMHLIIIALHGGIHIIYYLKTPANGFMDKPCVLVLAKFEKDNPVPMMITVTISFLGPFVILLILNGLIIQGLQGVKQRKTHLQSRTTSTNQDTSHNALCTLKSDTPTKLAQIITAEVGQTQKKEILNNIYNEQLLINQNKLFPHKCDLQQWCAYTLTNASNSKACKSKDLGIDTPIISNKDSDNQYEEKRVYVTAIDVNNSMHQYVQKESAVDRLSIILSQLNLDESRAIDNIPGPSRIPTTSQHETRTRRGTNTSSNVTSSSNKSKASVLSELITHAMAEPISFDVDIVGEDKNCEDDTTLGKTTNDIEENKQKSNMTSDRSKRISSLTRLLITASFIFLFLNIPFWGYYAFFSERLSGKDVGCYFRKVILKTLLLIKYSNHSVNFFLYCATGSRFWEEFTDMMKGMRSR